jgi:arylsulfatase A-like enzyme
VTERRPDIVMILTDDHAAHAIGAYGSAVNTTPRIDEIGRLGRRFDNCFATNSLCSPSRASNHKAPHRPWIPSPRHRHLYTGPIPLPPTFGDDYGTRTSSARRAAMRIAEHLTLDDLKVPPPAGLSYEDEALWKYQRFMEDYLRCVASVDDNVGRVIDFLRERGELDDTILIYASDQGFFLGDHGWFDKRFMYEESLRMPLLLSYPRAVTPGVVTEMVTNVDWAQTLLEAAGVPAHPRMQGRSFWGLLHDRPAEPRDGVYYRYWEHDDVFHQAPAHYGYRTARYKLIYFYNDGLGLPGCGPDTYPPEWELYDLRADPAELRNVYYEPAYAEVRDRLAAAMWREQAALGDQPHPSQPKPVML